MKKKVIIGVNDCNTLYPELQAQVDDGTDLSTLLPGSHSVIRWRCPVCHMTWSAQLYSRTLQSTGCPYCAHLRPIPGVNDLATVNPSLAQEWSPNNTIKPCNVLPQSNLYVKWICPLCKMEYTARIASRTQNTKCPYCASKKAIPGVNDLATLHPELVQEWLYAYNHSRPENTLPQSHTIVHWRCIKCGHEWDSPVYARTAGKGCKHCSKKNRNQDNQRSLDTLADEFSDKNPVGFPLKNPQSNLVYTWKCIKCGKEWTARMDSRYNGNACPHCANRHNYKLLY